jgi:hypothetical protein
MLNILMFEGEQERAQRELNERKRTKGDLCLKGGKFMSMSCDITGGEGVG